MQDAHVAFLDRYYRSQRHLYDASRRLFLFGRDAMLDSLPIADGDRVLEVGCGTARNLKRLARRVPDARYFGIDASFEMLAAAARRMPAKADITLRRGLAERMDYADTFGLSERFDVAFFSYSLSMMPDWNGALQAAWSNLKPGGRLVVVDFWDFASWPGWLARRLRMRLRRHHVRFDPAMHAALRELGPCRIRSVLGRWGYIAELTR